MPPIPADRKGGGCHACGIRIDAGFYRRCRRKACLRMDRQLDRQPRHYRHLPDAHRIRNCCALAAAGTTYTGHASVRRSCAKWRHYRYLRLCTELCCARAARTFAQRLLHDLDWRSRRSPPAAGFLSDLIGIPGTVTIVSALTLATIPCAFLLKDLRHTET